MPLNRQVITALERNGTDKLGINNLALKLVDETRIVSGSLLTVESNHFCVLKSRGALNVYDIGQYTLVTPDKPIIGGFVQGFFSGPSPWQYEVTSTAPSCWCATGVSLPPAKWRRFLTKWTTMSMWTVRKTPWA